MLRALLVATIPASQFEFGAEGVQAIVTRAENLFGRAEAIWHTASTEENTKIVRRRLFNHWGRSPLAGGGER